MDPRNFITSKTARSGHIYLPDGTILERITPEYGPSIEAIKELAKLPYFPKLHTVFTHEVRGEVETYVHMDLVEPPTLYDRVQEGGVFDWLKFLALMQEVESKLPVPIGVFILRDVVYRDNTIMFAGYDMFASFEDTPPNLLNQIIDGFSIGASIAFIRDNIHNITWNKYRICDNPNIPNMIEELLTLPFSEEDGEWNWDVLSRWAPMHVVHKYPEHPWEVECLSINRYITFPDIKRIDIDKDWDWNNLTSRLPGRDILENPDRKWHVRHIASNPTMTYERLRDGGFISETPSDKDHILAYKGECLPIDYVRRHPAVGYAVNTISSNPGIHPFDYNYIQSEDGERLPWDTYELIRVIPFDTLCSYPFIHLYRGHLSANPTAPIDGYGKYRDHGDSANYAYLSSHIDMCYVREHPDKEWNKEELSRNPSITLEDVDTLQLPNATREWNWFLLSQTISMDVIRADPHRKWDLHGLSRHPDLTQEDVLFLSFPNKVVDWDYYMLYDRYFDIAAIN